MATNQKILIMNDDQSIQIENIKYIDAQTIETKNHILEKPSSKKYYEDKTGMIYYIFNCDLPAKMEAENLKQLRRSTALKSLFNYEKDGSFNYLSLMPWAITALAIMF